MIIEMLGLAATVALIVSLIGFIGFGIGILLDDDDYFFRKISSDAWCACMTCSWFIALSLVIMVFLFP